jgi:hypothetical protein
LHPHPQRPRNLKAKRIARALIALAWLMVAGLGAECAVRLRDVLSERDAGNFMGNLAPPAPGMRRANPEEQETIQQHGFLPSAPLIAMAADQQQPSTQAAGNAPEDSQDATTRFWSLYRESDEDSRNARAALDGECWFLYTEDGSLETCFGDPDIELVLGKSRFGSVDSIKSMGDFQPGIPQRVTTATNPMWDYDATLYKTTVPGEGAPATLLHFRNTTTHLSYEELGARYIWNNAPAFLIPMFTLRPNFDNGFVISDQFGFENRPVAMPKPGNAIRIVCIGGSTTHEATVDGFRTTTFLEKFLDGQYPGYQVEVINCGMPSLDSSGMRRHARQYLHYQPDLIIYYEGINDIAAMFQAVRGGMGSFRSTLLRSRAITEFFNRPLLIKDNAFKEHWNSATRRNLLAIRLAADEAGVPMAACSITYPRRGALSWREWNYILFNARNSWGAGVANYATITRLLDLHNAYLKEMCETHQMGYIPLDENFRHGMSHFRDLCHFVPQGMQERASVLQSWLDPWVRQRIAQLEGNQQPAN